MRRDKRFTVYDAMEANGVFDSNPANAESKDFAGPVAYPKMFYHPTGATRITVPAEIIITPLGPKAVGEQSEIIWQIAQNKVEAEALIAEGWHNHPAKAIGASGKAAPQMSSDQRINELEEMIRKLQSEAQDARASKLAETGVQVRQTVHQAKTAVKTAVAAAE